MCGLVYWALPNLCGGVWVCLYLLAGSFLGLGSQAHLFGVVCSQAHLLIFAGSDFGFVRRLTLHILSVLNVSALFDFEKLDVYQVIRDLNKNLLPFIFQNQKNYPYLCDQLKRASLSAMLNLSEGTGRMGAQDKKQFYIRARASVFECVSILQVLLDLNVLKLDLYKKLYNEYEKVSKMMLGMIRGV